MPNLNELTLYGTLLKHGTYERLYLYNGRMYNAVKYPSMSSWNISEVTEI